MDTQCWSPFWQFKRRLFQPRTYIVWTPVWGDLGPSEPAEIIWEHLGASGSICEHLGAFGSIWEHLGHLGASGGIWEHLGASGSICEHLGASGNIWEHLGASVSNWEHHKIVNSFDWICFDWICIVAASSILHEVKHPKIVPPPGHPQGGGTISIEYVLVVIYLWLVASTWRLLNDSWYRWTVHIIELSWGQFSRLVVGTPRSEAS